MEIKTERLIIRLIDLSYIESACAYTLNPENAKMMVYLPHESREETERFLKNAELEHKKEKPDFYEFAVILGNTHIGGISMYFEGDFSRGEFGWIIQKDYWGNGYAAEAAKGLMRYFSNEMGIRRFIAHCDSENTASRRVMEKLGMKLVKIHGGRKNRSSDDERTECLYEIYV